MSDHGRFILEVQDEQQLDDRVEQVYDLVWRFDFGAPGFVVLDIPPGPDSHVLRAWMLRLKLGLSDTGVRRGRGAFAFRSLSRFDQQVTTKFHLDGAPDQSLLILGYEPSEVKSRLFLADYSRAAFDQGITPLQFLQDFNPMYKTGEDLLREYVTELPSPALGHSRIVAINNSALPFSEARTNSLGVFHKATIDSPDSTKRRIINSTMLALEEQDTVDRAQQHEYVTTDKISQRDY